MMDKIKIGSCQINVDFEGKSYLPYSIGLLQAYVLHNSKNPSKFEFQTTIFKRQELLTSVNKLKEKYGEQYSLDLETYELKETPKACLKKSGNG